MMMIVGINFFVSRVCHDDNSLFVGYFPLVRITTNRQSSSRGGKLRALSQGGNKKKCLKNEG